MLYSTEHMKAYLFFADFKNLQIIQYFKKCQVKEQTTKRNLNASVFI